MFQTIFAGVSVFVLGQFILRLVLDPIVSFKEALGETSALFLQHQAIITNANGTERIRAKLKCIASKLLSRKQSIPWYSVMSSVFRLPSSADVIEGCRSLNLVATEASRDIQSDRNVTIITDNMCNIEEKLGITVRYG